VIPAARYDGIVIGAGPNGLCVGAYLAKAGQKVLLLDRRLEIGGGLATEQVTIPGFLHNTHAVYHAMVDYAPVFDDLRLAEDYGLRFVKPEVVMSMPLMDGRALSIYADPERTCTSLAKISPTDAQAYRETYHLFRRFMDEFLAPATYVRAHGAFEALVKMESYELTRELRTYQEKSPRQIVDEIYENEHVRALMLYAACKWGLDYDLQGLGFLVPLYLDRAANYQVCVGGSHRLSHVMSKFIYDHGGMIWGSAVIKRIIVQDGVAKGVELADGRVIEAGWVASTIDPYQTFLEYVAEDNLSPDFVVRTRDFKWESMSLFVVSMALTVPPDFSAAAAYPDINRSFINVIGCETEDELIAHWDAVRRGELHDGGFNCAFPSVHDPAQAPSGRHTGLVSQHAPYKLHGDPQEWWGIRQEHARRLLATLRKYAPNINDETILAHYVCSPLDIENKFWNMKEGSIKVGGYYPLQMGYNRPNEYCSRHLTPIENLYIGGASVFPGGLVLFGSGYNCATAICEDQCIEPWWQPPSHVQEAIARGLL
jgi:phytoene dehydrogenase-like protein